MKPVYQTQFDSKTGNCLQASVASVLELPLDEVPNFMLEADLTTALGTFLAQFGMVSITLTASQVSRWRPSGFHLIGGRSLRGDFNHSVVGYNGEVIHDPHPSGGGLRTIDDYTLFVALLNRPLDWIKAKRREPEIAR